MIDLIFDSQFFSRPKAGRIEKYFSLTPAIPF